MNEIQNKRTHNVEKPLISGCMGRMVNLFDFGPGNRLLTYKPHTDDVVKKVMDPTRDLVDEKPIRYEPRRSSSNKKTNGTPMKMLIAQEMSKEIESKQKPPCLVAKLMGLDALPEEQPNPTSQGNPAKCHLKNDFIRSGTLPTHLHHESHFVDKQMQCGTYPFQEQQEYKDVYEVWQQSPKTNYIKDGSPEKGSHNEDANETGMALVRQKFREAKRLATDEKLRQSKEFQDALEVLSSNKELFLKFLQEPNSLFSQHLYELQRIPSLPHTKRITVLKPSKTIENNRFVGLEEMNQKPMRKPIQVAEADVWDKNKPKSSPFTNQNNESSTHPTRIVVLKPSPGKTHDIKAVASSPSLSPRLLHSKDFPEESEDDEAQCSREVAKEITRKMRETLSSYPREETVPSSVFSNGYIGDESSFNKSDNEYVGEGNLSDSEVMTPTSRLSWDYVNKFGSPYSSSFSRVSCSPESSVCREAKKRLSERWAMMASNGSGQEQRQVRRSSSTLGEMLALSETKKLARSSGDGIEGHSILSSRSCGGEEELRGTTLCLSSGGIKVEAGSDSPKNLLRSRSVPVSSTAYGARLNVEVPDPEGSKSNVTKEVEKSKGGKSSFKGKISSLFFSKNRKQNKDKSIAFPLVGLQDKFQSPSAEDPSALEHPSPVKISDDIPECVTNCGVEEGLSLSHRASPRKTSSPPSTCSDEKQGSHEAVLSVAKSAKAGFRSENHDQPSPISVLEAPFEDDYTTLKSSDSVKSDLQGPLVHLHPLKSNLIAKSPPIESLARSLSWDDASDMATPVQHNYSIVPSEAEEEQEWLLFIQKLLSSASLDGEEHSDAAFARWHSPECPLDPLLIDKFVNPKEDKLLRQEPKRRQRRSNQKLVFDCVNEALVDITRYESNASLWARVSSVMRKHVTVDEPVTVEGVWNRMREWLPGDVKCFSGESGDNNSLVVERVVKKEVVGRGWVELMRLEVDNIGMEIERKVLEELVEDALFGLTGRLH